MEASASLRERINEDMKAAMRAKDAPRLSAIRLLQAAIKQKEVDERITVDDTGVLGIVEKLIKQRKDSIEQFGKAGRTDLVAKEKAELDLLSMYLPQQMSEAELVAAVDAAIAEAGVCRSAGHRQGHGAAQAQDCGPCGHGPSLGAGETKAVVTR